MKKLISLFLFAMLPLVTVAAKYEEGKQYTQVSDKASKSPELREYYSFWCPHCFRFEGFYAEVKKQLPEGVAFERNHVDFLRFTTEDIQFMLTKGLVIAQQLKMEEQLVAAIFKYIHVQRASFSSEKDLRNLFVLNGVDGEQFDKLINSFTVNSKAKQMKKSQEYFTQKGALTGVPTVIVNNKYRINHDGLDRNNFEQDYMNVIKYLLTLD